MRQWVRSLRALASACALLLVAAGCSGAGEDHPGSAKPVAAGTGGAASQVVGFGGAPGASAGLDPLDGCAYVEERAINTYRPIDVIFVIDNSSSMDDEIAQVQARLNGDLARILAESGLDYRVILISRYGKVGVPVGDSDNPICIGAPLGGGECSDPMAAPPSNGERFFQFSADVGSHDAWCTLLGAFKHGDEY